jgi:hypothetical protein
LKTELEPLFELSKAFWQGVGKVLARRWQGVGILKQLA